MINLAVIFSFFLQIMNPGVQTIGNSGGIYNPGTAPPTCGTEPTWDYEFLATTITPGTLGPGSTIIDSSGSGHTATIAVGSPVAGTAVTTPNGTQTLQMTNNAMATLAGTPIANGTAVAITATFVLDNVADEKKSLTGTDIGSLGAYAYYPTSNGFGPQGLDSSVNFNIGNGTSIPPVTPTWQTTVVVYAPGSAPIFYRSDGTTGAMTVDPTVNGTNSASGNGINVVFSSFNGGQAEGFNGSLVKLAIKAATITPTQVTTVGCLAKQNYGVN